MKNVFVIFVYTEEVPPQNWSYKNTLRICGNMIPIKLLSKFAEVTLPHGCSPVNLLHIFPILFHKNTLEWLLLYVVFKDFRETERKMFSKEH